MMQIDNEYLAGKLLLIDKELHWSSFDVVKKIRAVIRRRFDIKKIKVGHAGTLDPLASGLMIVCTGKMTKQIDKFQAADKEYIAQISLGNTTPSYDAETEIDQRFDTKHIDKQQVETMLNSFIGEQEQIPPVFSAISVGGQRAYKKARKGEHIELKARKVRIEELELLEYSQTQIHIRVVCSKGTYIRALARDIGTALDSGAYLTALQRTRIGDSKIENAILVSDFTDKLFATSN